MNQQEPPFLTRAATITLVIAALFLFPPTRNLLVFIAPTGTGLDDLIVWSCLLAFAGLLVLNRIGRLSFEYQRRRAVFLFIVFSTVVTILLSILFSSSG